MTRRTDLQRDSHPSSHELFSSVEQKAELEARNGLLQFDERLRLVDDSKNGFRLRSSVIQKLQRLAIKDIYTEGRIDVSLMEHLLEDMLANQLVSVIEAVGSSN